MFLGFDQDQSPCFTFEAKKTVEYKNINRNLSYFDSREVATEISQNEAGILAQAKSNIDWNRKNKYCSSCGNHMKVFRGGHYEKMSNCKLEHFPRTDPVVIMLVYKDNRCVFRSNEIKAKKWILLLFGRIHGSR